MYSVMKNSHLIVFAVVAGFSGFLLGYSIPPIIDIRFGDSADFQAEGQPGTDENQDLSDSYKQLQELQQ
jgi:hypothetical protein